MAFSSFIFPKADSVLTGTIKDGEIVNADISASAAIAFSKLANLTNNTMLYSNSSGDVTSLAAATNGQLLIGSSSAAPALGTLTAGAGVSITNGAGSITVAVSGAGFTWTEVTGTTQALAIENGYVANNAGLVTLTLPTTAAIGDTIIVVGKGAGGWRVAQNAGQTIHFNSTDTTAGVGGRLDSTNRYNTVELVCITANTDFVVLASSGTITVT